MEANNWDYRQVVNAWSAERLAAEAAAAEAAALISTGLEVEAADDDDSEDEAEAAAPDDTLYPRKFLRVRQIDPEESADDPPDTEPDDTEARDLEHLGNSDLLPVTASAQIQDAVLNPITDLEVTHPLHPPQVIYMSGVEVFENRRVTAQPLSAWDPQMERLPFPELYPNGRFGYDYGRPAFMYPLPPLTPPILPHNHSRFSPPLRALA